MVRSRSWSLRAAGLGVTTVMLVAACGGTPASQPPAGSGAPQGTTGPAETDTTGPQAGGTIYVLTQAEQWNHVDPQRAYTGEDLAFFGGTTMRALTAYKFSPDETEGTSLVPDMATDLGTATNGGATWSFTLRDGLTWQDGSEVTCEDVKYGVSRTFANTVISEGPTYAVQYLDIPAASEADAEAGYLSSYHGPYDEDNAEGQAAFDEAVVCDGKTITFNLNGPHADFNYTVTLGFGAVPEAADTGETYGTVAPYVMSNGPYKVESYTTGNGGKYVLVRNEEWDPASDDYRKAYPDRWEVHFGIDPKILDQRIMEASGEDAYAIQYGQIQPENLGIIFTDTETTAPEFDGRAISGFDPYSRYYWIDTNKVSNVKIRQAMAVALDREAIRLNIGGAFAGDFADGAIKPNIGQDYAETNLWDAAGVFGRDIPDTGDPEFAKQLIQESGEAAPELVFNYAISPTNEKTASIVISSLAKAGITVTPAGLEPGSYYSVVFDPEKSGHFGTGGWGADWPNASTVIPPLFTQKGGWDLAQIDDPDFNAAVDAANAELDRAAQAKMWQDLNKEAAEKMWHIPTFFGLSQTIAGTKVGPVYRWSAYGSWPYGEMYVTE